MPRSNSGRIVIEIDPALKDRLYVALAIRKLTLREWFIQNSTHYIQYVNQPDLFEKLVAETHAEYLKDREQ